MFSSKMCFTSILLAALSIKGVTSIAAPIEGFNVVDLEWEIPHTPGKAPEVFSGTIEQAMAAAAKRNPDFHYNYALDADTIANMTLPEPEVSTSLDKRGDTWNCNPRPHVWIPAYYEGVVQGIKYLRTVPGKPSNGPGPGNCGRVSCSYQCSIWWCNDNDFTKVLPSFNNIADGAQVLVDKCTEKDPYAGAYKFVRGQLFHDDRWNVVVRLDNDKC